MICAGVLIVSILSQLAVVDSVYLYPYQTSIYPHHSGLVFPFYYPLTPTFRGTAGVVPFPAPLPLHTSYSTVKSDKKVDAKYYYGGHFKGTCSIDGLYYKDDTNFVICSNGYPSEQPCPAGTKTSGSPSYQAGYYYGHTDLCSVNLVDYRQVVSSSETVADGKDAEAGTKKKVEVYGGVDKEIITDESNDYLSKTSYSSVSKQSQSYGSPSSSLKIEDKYLAAPQTAAQTGGMYPAKEVYQSKDVDMSSAALETNKSSTILSVEGSEKINSEAIFNSVPYKSDKAVPKKKSFMSTYQPSPAELFNRAYQAKRGYSTNEIFKNMNKNLSKEANSNNKASLAHDMYPKAEALVSAEFLNNGIKPKDLLSPKNDYQSKINPIKDIYSAESKEDYKKSDVFKSNEVYSSKNGYPNINIESSKEVFINKDVYPIKNVYFEKDVPQIKDIYLSEEVYVKENDYQKKDDYSSKNVYQNPSKSEYLSKDAQLTKVAYSSKNEYVNKGANPSKDVYLNKEAHPAKEAYASKDLFSSKNAYFSNDAYPNKDASLSKNAYQSKNPNKDEYPTKNAYLGNDAYSSPSMDEYPSKDAYLSNDAYLSKDAYPSKGAYPNPNKDEYLIKDTYLSKDVYSNKEAYPNKDTYSKDTFVSKSAYPSSGRDEYPSKDAYVRRDAYLSKDTYLNKEAYPSKALYPVKEAYERKDTYPTKDESRSNDAYSIKDAYAITDDYLKEDAHLKKDASRTNDAYISKDEYKSEDSYSSKAAYPSKDKYSNQNAYQDKYTPLKKDTYISKNEYTTKESYLSSPNGPQSKPKYPSDSDYPADLKNVNPAKTVHLNQNQKIHANTARKRTSYPMIHSAHPLPDSDQSTYVDTSNLSNLSPSMYAVSESVPSVDIDTGYLTEKAYTKERGLGNVAQGYENSYSFNSELKY